MPLSQKRKLRILICGQIAPDLAAIEATLDASTVPISHTRVERLSELKESQKAEAFDALLLDSRMIADDWTAGFASIQTLAEKTVVLLIAEEQHRTQAVEALGNGLDDFILRDDLQAERIEHAIIVALNRRRQSRPPNPPSPDIGEVENFLTRILSTHKDPMLILGKHHDIRFLNPAAVTLLETDASSVIGEVFPFAVEAGDVTELEIPTSSNTIHTLELTAFELIWKGAEALLIILREVNDAQKVGQNLLLEQERLRTVLDAVSEAIVLTDAEGRIERISQGAAQLLGGNELTYSGLHLSEIMGSKASRKKKPATQDSEREGLPNSTASRSQIQSSLRLANGEELPVTATLHDLLDEAGKPRGCAVLLEKTAENGVADTLNRFEAEALNSVGLLVGGIAHDFNNMLTAILGNLALARLANDPESPISQKLEAAECAALQAKSLSQQLLTFSREGALAFTQTSIPDLIEESARFILRGSNVDFELTTPDDLWPVEADKSRISQVINNLLINADQAMPKGGRIEICLRNLNIRRAEVPNLAPGDYVCIEVKDTGTGISPENLKQLFTPYFTTKENGNGLGLASSFSIARSHNGTITADSSFGYGSIFRVYLPRSLSQQEDSDQTQPKATMEQKQTIHQGHGRILLMDDMEAMLMVAGEILTMLGYEVECAADGEEAIVMYKKAKESGNAFDAVVFDLTVPGGMGGEEAANLLKAYDPDLVAIASSGYSNSNVMSDYKNSAFKAVVPKPYRIDEMSSALHSLLQGT